MKRLCKSAFIVRLSLAGLLVVPGCASTPNVGYEANAQHRIAKNVSIFLESFEDGRTGGENGVLGGVYNGYNMRMGNVAEPSGMISSLKKTLKSELHSAGYILVEDNRDLSMKVVLLALTCDLKTSSESNITLQVDVRDKGQEVFSKNYNGQGSVFQIISQDSSGAINKAVRNVAVQIISDLDEYIAT